MLNHSTKIEKETNISWKWGEKTDPKIHVEMLLNGGFCKKKKKGLGFAFQSFWISFFFFENLTLFLFGVV